MMQIQVIGAGSWGLALARLLAHNGHIVWLYCRHEDGPEQLRITRESPFFLHGVSLPDSIQVDTQVEPHVEMVVYATPSHVLRKVAQTHAFPPDTIRVIASKGIENDSLMRMSEVIGVVCGDVPVVSLSGPSHAEEVARDKPASVVAASRDQSIVRIVQDVFMSPTFRVYTSPDQIGVELGGALKNVIAIAAGVCDGCNLGDNAKAALITRGLAEMARLGIAMGAEPITFSGLSGMGDLIVTCESQHSRNRALGERLACGEKIDDILASSMMVAEGYRTSKSAHMLAERHNVEMPITHKVYETLYEGANIPDAIDALMQRNAKPEKG